MPQLAPHIFNMLHQQGVQHAFGIPGDFALTLCDALAESEIQPIVMTHEPSAGFAADAYSRIRGLGLAVVTYGVGGLNMVNPVAGAYAEKSPLVVGTFLTDINLGLFSAHLEPAYAISATSEHISVKHHQYPNDGAYASLRMMAHQTADFVKIPRLDYAQLAELMGGRGFVIKTGEQLCQAFNQACTSESFCLFDVHLAADDVSPASQQIASLFAKTLKG
ncbi:thiamine pyrophosphate-binding protein [Leptothoe sp. ISB3NOV94-8A]|nr:thiamine pyrophosphate-binding protein [Leptothoe sp. LEGE 181152]